MRYCTCSVFLCLLVIGSAYSAADVISDPAMDFANSELVLLGRVVGVELVREADTTAKEKGLAYFGYYARVRALRVLKGTIDVGASVAIPVGGYWAKEKDGDLAQLPILRNSGLRGLTLTVGGLYLLPIVHMPDAPEGLHLWSPRCQQASIIALEPDASGLAVERAGRPAVPLESFLTEFAGRR